MPQSDSELKDVPVTSLSDVLNPYGQQYSGGIAACQHELNQYQVYGSIELLLDNPVDISSPKRQCN